MAKNKKRTSTPSEGPIPWEVIEKQPPLPPAEPEAEKSIHSSIRRFYVTAAPGAKPKPSARVERIEGQPNGPALWEVTLDLDRTVETVRPGLKDESLDLPQHRSSQARRPVTRKAMDDYCPKWMGTSFKPLVRPPAARVLYEYRGRRYRPLYVFPPDERVELTDTSFPWPLVGKITTSDMTNGTGALIGKRTVLTARHVRPARSIADGNWWMKFTPHLTDATEPFGSSFISENRYYAMTGDVEFDTAHDFMVCHLYEPLGERLGAFGAQEYSEDWNDRAVWASVGYPADLAGGTRAFVQVPCTVEDSEDSQGGQFIETEADLSGGNSGGPFWAWFPGADGTQHARIIGVVSGEMDFAIGVIVPIIHDHDNVLAGGADMVQLGQWARDNWDG
jgi:V8-like Glu-specific endopeptidase